MTTNIVNIDAVDIRASMEAKAVLAMHGRYKPELPPDNFLEEIIDEARKAVEAGETTKQIPIVSFWWCGDKSGKSWDEIFIKHISRKIHGRLGLFVQWEQGPGMHLVVDNGRISAHPVPESSTVLSEAGLQQRAKAISEAMKPRLPEDIMLFLQQVMVSPLPGQDSGSRLTWLSSGARDLFNKYRSEKTG